MNQLDESVVTPASTSTDSPTSSVNDQATINPVIPAPTPAQPMDDPMASPETTVASTPIITAQTSVDATQTPVAPLEESATDALQSSLPTPSALPDLLPTDSLSGSIKTVPMPSGESTSLGSSSPIESPAEVKPLDLSQPLETASAPIMSSPMSSVAADVPQMATDSVTQPAVEDEVVPSQTEIARVEPLQVSPDTSSLPSEAETTISEPVGITAPLVDETNESLTTSSPTAADPVVIAPKPQVNPEPLPTPLTPPTIKTSPSPVLATPPPTQSAAPVNVTMSSPTTEPVNNAPSQSAPALVKGAGKYQVRVINEKCIGAASCVAVAPKAFKLNEQQIAEVLASASEESDENLLLAAQSCPTMAIEIIDSETGKKVWPR